MDKAIKKFIVLALFTLFTLSTLSALEDDDIIAGARTGALGGSYAALADGYQSMFVNPAGLCGLAGEGIYSGFGHYYAVPLSNYHFGYMRPFSEEAAAGAAWSGMRAPLKQLDRFYLTWSQKERRFPGMPRGADHYFSWGWSLRALNLRTRNNAFESFKSKVGAGIDAGALVAFPSAKTQFGASIIGYDSANLDLPGPHLIIGVMRRFGPLALMVDWRARNGLKTFFPGAEIDLFHGLAQIRAGRGMRLGSLHTIAFGFGFNLLPLTVDMALHIPYEGLHRREGAAMLSLGWSFGGKSHYELFTGKSAEESQRLAMEIEAMEAKKTRLKKDLYNSELDLKILREDIAALEKRRREETAYDELRRAQAERQEEAAKPKPKPKPVEWPKYHRVSAGDTLRKIAADYYGDPEFWELIYKTNPAKIIRGLPKTGETLEIPKPQ